MDTQQTFIENTLVLSTLKLTTFYLHCHHVQCVFYPHFTDEETDSERLLNLSVVTQLRASDSDAHAF